MFNREDFKKTWETQLRLGCGKTFGRANTKEKYRALAKTVMVLSVDDWIRTEERIGEGKVAYYMSLEFLMGRFLSNTLLNTGYYEEIRSLVEEVAGDFSALEEKEYDAGLGNGGLGRLAACFLESAATSGLPLYGYGLRYREGMFYQEIKDGFQVERGDHWLKEGDPWSLRKEEEGISVFLEGTEVRAIPYDYPVPGFHTDFVGTLRLWQCEALEDFDFQAFNDFHYDEALREKNRAEDITRVLYPNDGAYEGKLLRFKQQYFFASATMKDLLGRHKRKNRPLIEFAKYHAIQLNDTHPVIAIPELMRLLVDEEGMDFDLALREVQNTFHYTNHTILKEAMEQWPSEVICQVCPRTFEYIVYLNHRCKRELQLAGYTQRGVEAMDFFKDGMVQMAYLGVYGSRKVNGVAELHTKILKERELRDWAGRYPEKFLNITNGVTPRRWLQGANPELTAFIDERIGDHWKRDMEALGELRKYADDPESIREFQAIKAVKKRQLAETVKRRTGETFDPDTLLDVQVKRIHEYKRQLLNGLHIYHLYLFLKENPQGEFTPRTFLFAGKAAPGYFRAKGIIKYLTELARVINGDPEVKDRLKVLFLPNYEVSLGEKIFPAADISEQISTAGKEASGTGNMKFMMNGALTLGTWDGANIEIFEQGGLENNYLFGAKAEELYEINSNYEPWKIYGEDPVLKRAVDSLMGQTLNDNHSFMFLELYNSLLQPGPGYRDPYFILKDFDSYRRAQKQVAEDFLDEKMFRRKGLLNIAGSGKFSADRTVAQYAKEIWGIPKYEK